MQVEWASSRRLHSAEVKQDMIAASKTWRGIDSVNTTHQKCNKGTRLSKQTDTVNEMSFLFSKKNNTNSSDGIITCCPCRSKHPGNMQQQPWHNKVLVASLRFRSVCIFALVRPSERVQVCLVHLGIWSFEKIRACDNNLTWLSLSAVIQGDHNQEIFRSNQRPPPTHTQQICGHWNSVTTQWRLRSWQRNAHTRTCACSKLCFLASVFMLLQWFICVSLRQRRHGIILCLKRNVFTSAQHSDPHKLNQFACSSIPNWISCSAKICEDYSRGFADLKSAVTGWFFGHNFPVSAKLLWGVLCFKSWREGALYAVSVFSCNVCVY